MHVAFNLEDDFRFKDSLESLEKAVARNTILTLLEIQEAEISWEEFVEHYHWLPLPIAGSDTYPGANQLCSFQIIVDETGTQVEIVGFSYEGLIVICSIARIP